MSMRQNTRETNRQNRKLGWNRFWRGSFFFSLSLSFSLPIKKRREKTRPVGAVSLVCSCCWAMVLHPHGLKKKKAPHIHGTSRCVAIHLAQGITYDVAYLQVTTLVSISQCGNTIYITLLRLLYGRDFFVLFCFFFNAVNGFYFGMLETGSFLFSVFLSGEFFRRAWKIKRCYGSRTCEVGVWHGRLSFEHRRH